MRSASFRVIAFSVSFRVLSTERKRWLFLSEREALKWFGMPDSVSASENGELWIYGNALDSVQLVFHHGRLVEVY